MLEKPITTSATAWDDMPAAERAARAALTIQPLASDELVDVFGTFDSGPQIYLNGYAADASDVPLTVAQAERLVEAIGAALIFARSLER